MPFHQLDISEGKNDNGKEQLMDQELFNPQSSSVSSSRIIYTPSTFARTSLLHLQEVGSLQAVHPHIFQRENLVSFLCVIVLSGEGELSYEGQTYQLSEGDCGFIDCRKAYSHSTSDNLWSLQWCHFYAPSLPAVYEKYKERGGRPVFHPDKEKLFRIANSLGISIGNIEHLLVRQFIIKKEEDYQTIARLVRMIAEQ
mgnify:FL=1